jgi:hypothetical protein
MTRSQLYGELIYGVHRWCVTLLTPSPKISLTNSRHDRTIDRKYAPKEIGITLARDAVEEQLFNMTLIIATRLLLCMLTLLKPLIFLHSAQGNIIEACT